MADTNAAGAARAVIFDMDGVLVDSSESHYRAWIEVCREEGMELERGVFLRTLGTGNDVTVGIIFGEVSPERFARLTEAKEKAFRRAVTKHVLEIDGAAELVRRLKDAGWRLAIATSAPRANLDCVLETFPALDLFDVKVDADMVHTAKPAPHIFLEAARQLGIGPAHCVVIEDSLAGLESAERACMTRVGLTTTIDLAELMHHADMVVDSLRDLSPEILGELLDDNAE